MPIAYLPDALAAVVHGEELGFKKDHIVVYTPYGFLHFPKIIVEALQICNQGNPSSRCRERFCHNGR